MPRFQAELLAIETWKSSDPAPVAFEAHPDLNDLAYRCLVSRTKGDSCTKDIQQYMGAVLDGAYRKGVRIFSIQSSFFAPFEYAERWMKLIERFNRDHISDPMRLRLVFSPNAKIHNDILLVWKGAPEVLKGFLAEIKRLESAKVLTLSAQDHRELETLVGDPCLDHGTSRFLDGYPIDSASGKLVKTAECPAKSRRNLRARLGRWEDERFDDYTFDFSKPVMKAFVAANLSIMLQAVRSLAPHSPIHEVTLVNWLDAGEFSIVNANTNAKRGVHGRPFSAGNDWQFISFDAEGARYTRREAASFPARYRYYQAMNAIWAQATRTLVSTVKHSDPRILVSFYAHPNLPTWGTGILEPYLFYTTSGVDLLQSSWMPPAPPYNDSVAIEDQLGVVASTARLAGAQWRMDYSGPTTSWRYVDQASRDREDSLWLYPEMGLHRVEVDVNRDGVPETVTATNAWDLRFLRSDGYPSGRENAAHYLAEAIAAMRLGACGMNYTNWPSHWIADGPEPSLNGTGWSKLIGGPKDDPRAALEELHKHWVDFSPSTRPSLVGHPREGDAREKVRAAIYVNAAAKLQCEEERRCSPRDYARLNRAAKELSGSAQVDFLSDEMIVRKPTLLDDYEFVVLFPPLSIPSGDARTAWDSDPRAKQVDQALQARKKRKGFHVMPRTWRPLQR